MMNIAFEAMQYPLSLLAQREFQKSGSSPAFCMNDNEDDVRR